MSSLTDPLGPDLTATLRALKLGKLTATLPERLTLARQHDMPHADFLQLILSDEVARREAGPAGSIALRARILSSQRFMRTLPVYCSKKRSKQFCWRRCVGCGGASCLRVRCIRS